MNGVEAVASWLTPTVLFCVLNLMIGTIFIASALKPPHTKDEQPPPPQLVRVPSFFERVKSFNLSRSETQQPDPAHHTVVPAEEEEPHHEPHHVTRSKSAAVAKVEAAAAKVLQKSASEKVMWTEREDVEEEERRRPATTREKTAGEDEAVDEKADDFINRFRQQLRLQRLDSLLRGMGR